MTLSTVTAMPMTIMICSFLFITACLRAIRCAAIIRRVGQPCTAPCACQSSDAGSRERLDDVLRLVDAKRIKPVVDRVFGFHEAPQAYAYLQSAQHFGKVAIRVAQ